MSFFKGFESLFSNFAKNEMFDYLKFAMYGTDDKNVVRQKDEALQALFNGIEEMNKKNYEAAQGWIKNSIGLYDETHDTLRKAFSEFFMGEMYETMKNFTKAMEYYEKAHEVFKTKASMMALNVEKKIDTLKKELVK